MFNSTTGYFDLILFLKLVLYCFQSLLNTLITYSIDGESYTRF